MPKPNPILAAYKAQLDRDYHQRLSAHSEVSLLALVIAADDECVPDIDALLTRYISVKAQIAADLLEDSKADKTLTYTKHDLARRVKTTINWQRFRTLFSLLRDYWEE